jgi:DNA-binding transcriptional ArsR family regulator
MFQQTRPAELDAIFGALADASRRSILSRLTAGETTVSELARPLDMSMPAVLKHLRVLENVGLVRSQKNGRVKRCQLEPARLQAANDWLEQMSRFWNAQLDRLSGYLDRHDSAGQTISKENRLWLQRPPHRSKLRSTVSTGSRAQKSSRRGRTRKN